MAAGDPPKKRTFRTYTYRGVELDKLLDMNIERLTELFKARQRRKFIRGIGRRPKNLLEKLRKEKTKVQGKVGEKPTAVRTHLRSMVIVPEMIGSVVAIYNGKTFSEVEIKPEMVGHYLAEFAICYKPVRHGKPGIGATHSSRFIPLK
eukprot:CAMPEP_0113846844 /NCGR_PEP_ID=MMETSP0372-20130328/1531_1 /TAXON_ID=340204 /ORGANISM="Lankesteria abbotti" /LENGTH=147 /DNA_ID=CAMNT_0000816029 /DNA_START=54 /DNA_END=497 /DNA_ORIENTATION=- /assembly_acc=CAM_ASM_000359